MDIDTKEAAKIVGCGNATIVRMLGKLKPTKVTVCGLKTYRMYDRDDVVAIKAALDDEKRQEAKLVEAIGRKYYSDNTSTYASLAKEFGINGNRAAWLVRKYNEAIRVEEDENE